MPHIDALPFVTDTTLRSSLRSDLDSVERALAGGDWKSATVIGGSVVEAMLLWAIQRKSNGDIQAAVATLIKMGAARKNLGPDPEMWFLADYIGVATELKLIRPETASQANLLNGFRNLIHPGRTARTGQACNRGTAHAAQAAIAFVIADLE